jgi:hypothetical protein
MPVAIATIVLFLPQIAILTAPISFEKAVPEEYVHTKRDHQRRGSEGQVRYDLREKGIKMRLKSSIIGVFSYSQIVNRS